MTANLSVMSLSFGRSLTAQQLEEELNRQERVLGPSTPAMELNINLSQLEWADLGALAQLALLVLRHSAREIRITVLLPSRAISEQDASPASQRARTDELRFLEYLRFPDCILELRSHAVALIDVTVDGIEWSRETASDSGSTYKRVIPLRWVSLEDSESRDRQAGNIIAAAENAGIGLDAFDARALSNVILYELIENVANHAMPAGKALVCGMAHRHFNLQRVDDFPAEERPYLSLLNQNGQSFVEILVGDAGAGIVATLDRSYRRIEGARAGNLSRSGKTFPHRVVRWAFDRWSSAKAETRERRGVRGLFRVDRIAAKYRGLISVRTHRTFFTRDHSCFDSAQERYRREPKAFSQFEGTLIRLRLVPQTDFSPRLRSRAQSIVSVDAPLMPLPVAQQTIKTVFISDSIEHSISSVDKDRILATMSVVHTRPDLLLVVFSSNFSNGKMAVERALEFLAKHASPVPIFALNLGGSDDELALSVRSVNEQLERASKATGVAADMRESCDMFGVLSATGKIYWCGLPHAIAQRLRTNNDQRPVQIEPTHSLTDLPQMAPAFFSLEPSRIEPRRITLRPKWHISLLLEELKNLLRTLIKHGKPAQGIRRGQVFLTPTLRYVDTWIESERLINSLAPTEIDGLVFALCVELHLRLDISPQSLLLSTPSSSVQLRNGIKRSLQLVEEVEPHIAYSDPAIPYLNQFTGSVLVYSDVVSSEEAARRAAQFARNHGLPVQAVACLIDTRERSDITVRVLGEEIPLVALLHYPTQTEPKSTFLAISPSLLWTEPENIAEHLIYESDPLLMPGSPLMFGHFKRPNGRHLTLTIDVEQLLSTAELTAFVRNEATAFLKTVNKAQKALQKLAVWVPVDKSDDRKRRDAITSLFERALPPGTYELFIRPKISLNGNTMFDPNGGGFDPEKFVGLLIFDWGVITGSTIHTLVNLAANDGADHICILVGSTQLAAHEIQFLKLASKLSVRRQGTVNDLFSAPMLSHAEVSIHFADFSTLSLGLFSQYECPVCRQAAELSRIPLAVDFLDGYISNEIARLDGFRQVDLGDGTENDRRLWIGRMRHALNQAKTSTLLRKYIFDEIIALQESDLMNGNARVNAIGLVELLYIEQQWLKLAPLHFRSCRKAIARICVQLVETADGRLQTLAISVLRRTSKTEFISSSVRILRCLANNPLAQQALLSGMHSYIARNYHQGGNLTLFARSIGQIYRMVLASDGKPVDGFLECGQAVNYLKVQATFLRHRSDAGAKARPRLMFQLKDTLRSEYKPHTAAAAASTHLTALSFAELLESVCASSHDTEGMLATLINQVESKRRNWETCRSFLLAHVIPLLVNLGTEFSSPHFRMQCESPQDLAWLREMIAKHRTGLAVVDLNKTLNTIEKFVRTGARPDERETALSALQEFKLQTGFLARVLLRAQKFHIRTGEQIQKASAVSQFLAGFPADLEDALVRARHDVSMVDVKFETIIAVGMLPKVYCPSELLIRTIGEILDNVRKYARTPLVEMGLTETSETIQLEFSNESLAVDDLSRTTDGHGLLQCTSELACFDGRLSVTRPGGRFVVNIRLRKWEDS